MSGLSTLGLLFLLTVASPADGSDYPASQKQRSPSQEKRSVQDVIRKISPRVEDHLRTFFERAGASYPPSRLTLIGLKDELELEVWAECDGKWIYIVTYDVLAASGYIGPKERAGDRQVPEGIYRISELNPNSRFHLSMKLDYPNDYDRMKAREDGRSNLGGDIYIHGKAKSEGCIAVGDEAIEELFVLAARTGIENTEVVIAPYDFRQRRLAIRAETGPAWLPELYEKLGQELQGYKTQNAVHNFDKAIGLKPQYHEAFNTRANSDNSSDKYQQAFKDNDKPIEPNPVHAATYFYRGNAYNEVGNYQEAIRDLSKALELKFEEAYVFDNRGFAYWNLGDYKQAIRDFKRALELDANDHYARKSLEQLEAVSINR